MSVDCAYQILGKIIENYKEGKPATLKDLKEYWKQLDKPVWEEKHSHPLAEVLIDLNMLERDGSIIVKGREKRPYQREYIPTLYGIFTYIDMQPRFNLPDIPPFT